jgi:hypothetical protein
MSVDTRHWHDIRVAEANGLERHRSQCRMPEQEIACLQDRQDAVFVLPPIVVPYVESTDMSD